MNTKTSILDSLAARRSVYRLGRALPVSEEEIVQTVTRAAELVPDAFNMRSQRVAVVFGARQDALWDAVYGAFGGKVALEKIDGFKAAAGTVLYYTDRATVEALQAQYALYAANFPVWAAQANGMLQLAVWSALRDLGLGANLQHYNPVIDGAVRELLGVPESWQLVAQMPFGSIAEPAGPKDGEDIAKRVLVFR
jgi:hypothetical protein